MVGWSPGANCTLVDVNPDEEVQAQSSRQVMDRDESDSGSAGGGYSQGLYGKTEISNTVGVEVWVPSLM